MTHGLNTYIPSTHVQKSPYIMMQNPKHCFGTWHMKDDRYWTRNATGTPNFIPPPSSPQGSTAPNEPGPINSINVFRKSCRLLDNVLIYGTARHATDDNITRRMRFARRITKATGTHAEYVILIAFPRQQWLCERASMLRYMYTASLVE
jgi:hypothetical protein